MDFEKQLLNKEWGVSVIAEHYLQLWLVCGETGISDSVKRLLMCDCNELTPSAVISFGLTVRYGKNNVELQNEPRHAFVVLEVNIRLSTVFYTFTSFTFTQHYLKHSLICF